ncbi:MAG: hypothetical protein R2716_06110 [Microthrixaceae bacterium]
MDLLTAAPQDMPSKVQSIIDGGASVFVAGLGVPRRWWTSATSRTCWW